MMGIWNIGDSELLGCKLHYVFHLNLDPVYQIAVPQNVSLLSKTQFMNPS